jgi:sugar phosphate isomerase/epimerase
VTNVKIGIQTRSLRQPLRQALQTAARLGADGVEIDARHEVVTSQISQTGLRQFRKLLEDLQLQVSAVAFPTRRGYDVTDDVERRIAATQSAMQLAYHLGCAVVLNRIGRVPASSDEPGFARLVEVLTALGVYGDRVGARLAALTGEERPEDLARLIAALPEEFIGVDLHPAALIRGGHSPVDALDILGRNVLHVHACDAVRDASGGRAFDVELGRGTADLPALVGKLTAQFDYRGWITVESHAAADPVWSAENAVAYLRAL